MFCSLIAPDRKSRFKLSILRFTFVREALDHNGNWRAIESVPPPICGRSHHHVFLPPGSFWEFVVPHYAGSFRTRLRFKLGGDHTIYSNEFEGTINPEQFNE